jgi:hypothetical protein
VTAGDQLRKLARLAGVIASVLAFVATGLELLAAALDAARARGGGTTDPAHPEKIEPAPNGAADLNGKPRESRIEPETNGDNDCSPRARAAGLVAGGRLIEKAEVN